MSQPKIIPPFVQSQQRTMRYLDEFLKLRCSTDLMRSGVFPNVKEITESFAAFAAVRKYGPLVGFDLFDSNVLLLAVGDGNTPRTGATFAMRSRWHCYSVDPRMKNQVWAYDNTPISRLYSRKQTIESINFFAESAVIVCVHSHASLPASVKAVSAKKKLVIAMQCCYDLSLPDVNPHWTYRDAGILSPEDLIKIYFLEE